MKFSMKGGSETSSNVKVPRFPVISLRATTGEVIVEAPGVYEEFTRDEGQSLFEVAEPAALKVTRLFAVEGVAGVRAAVAG